MSIFATLAAILLTSCASEKSNEVVSIPDAGLVEASEKDYRAEKVDIMVESLGIRPLFADNDMDIPMLGRSWSGRLVTRGSCLLLKGDELSERLVLPVFRNKGLAWNGTSLVLGDQTISVGETIKFSANMSESVDTYLDCGMVRRALVLIES